MSGRGQVKGRAGEHNDRAMKSGAQIPLLSDAMPTSQELGKSQAPENNGRANRLEAEDQPFHDWYRFVLSFPPHLVRTYLQEFGLESHHVILDPFCGTGTTLIESKLHGIPSIGIEANPFAHFASRVKVDWQIDPDLMNARAIEIAERTTGLFASQGIEDESLLAGDQKDLLLRKLGPEASKLVLGNSISPLPLHKALTLLDCLREHSGEDYYNHLLLAFANTLVFRVSNLRFGPEVGVGKQRADAPVVTAWLADVARIVADLRLASRQRYPDAQVRLADARQIAQVLRPNSIDAVITSPPYPNEKDYTRTTRLESVVLGFITSRTQLQQLKRNLVRSNTRGVYKGDDDDQWVAEHPEIQRIADAIEKRRRDLGKSSGFEKLYGRVTKLYFGGMARHLADLRTVLRPGARLAYVVGDQASYLRVMIRTGQLLADIAQALGYELERIDLFRTRFATATKEQLREEVVILRWRGHR